MEGKARNKVTRKRFLRYATLSSLLILFLLWLFCLPKPLFDAPRSTVVFDHNGLFVGAKIAKDGQWRFPQPDSVPHKVEACIIAFEDEWFRYHLGVNPISIIKAAFRNVRQGRVVSGGSTLSMQVVRLSRGNPPRSLIEKIIEAFIATRLEFSYSKDEILNLYMSNAPFGGNTVGLQTAAWRYYGRGCDKLSWAEAATLAVLPNAPSLIHPGKNREILITKRNRLLAKLLKNNVIDSTTYMLAKEEPLPDKPGHMVECAPHLIDRFNLRENERNIKSTIDLYIQKEAESIVSHYSSVYQGSNISNMAAVIVDSRSGKVLAYCGNASYNKKNNNYIDMVTASRSTGSTLKPFLYSAMLQEGMLLPSALVPDVPITISGYTPNNFNKSFDGAVPADVALAHSLNIPAVIALREYGINKFLDLLRRGGMTTLNNTADHYGLTLVLGGGESNLEEITMLYATMARTLCRFCEQRKYCKEDVHRLRFEENAEVEKETLQKTPTLFHAQSVWQTMEALKEVNRPGMIEWKNFSSSRVVAWKTGTSYGSKDAWAIGTTPEYTIGVWVGNATGEGRSGLTGVSHAAPVMFALFNSLPQTSWFALPPEQMITADVCPQSGYLCGPNCPKSVAKIVYRPQLESQTCPYHVLVHLSPDRAYRATTKCYHANELIQESWFVLPPTMGYYYRMHNADYAPLPPMKENCSGEAERDVMEFVYPKEGGRIFLPRGEDGKRTEAVFKVAHRDPAAIVYWHLDDVYVGKTVGTHENAISASAGLHQLTVTDEAGNSLRKQFEIVMP